MIIASLSENNHEFSYIEDKPARIKELKEKRHTNALQHECQYFNNLLALTWIDILTDSGLLNKIFIENFEKIITNKTSSNLSPFQKVMMFQIYTNMITNHHPKANLLTQLWPTNLEKNVLLSASLIECTKLDQLINDEQRIGAFFKSITSGYFIQNIYYNKKNPKIEHPIFLQKIPTNQSSHIQATFYINALLTLRFLNNTDGLLFEYSNFDDSIANEIAEDIRGTFK